mgnify:CR=1 FL=1
MSVANCERPAQALPIKSINVNVAARQLRESGFVDEVAAVLSDAGLIPANLILEVTESSVLDGRQVRSVYWRCYNGVSRPPR